MRSGNLIPWLGLLGLLAILVLILIYILKPKYEEKKVSSTFIWKLSLKYGRKKVPFDWLQNSLLIALQIIIITIIALLMAQPLFVQGGAYEGETIVILDTSVSMRAEKDGISRFDRAKKEIEDLADETLKRGNRFSLFVALPDGETAPASSVRNAIRSDDEALIRQNIHEARPSFGEANLEAALEPVINTMRSNPDATVYIFTDRNRAGSEGVRIVNVAEDEFNAAILSFTTKRDGYHTFEAEIGSYGRAVATFDIIFQLRNVRFADAQGVTQPQEEEFQIQKTVAAIPDGGTQTVRFNMTTDNIRVVSYESAYLKLNVDDGYSFDNEMYIFGGRTENVKVQLVYPAATENAAENILLTARFNALSNADVTPVPIVADRPNQYSSSGFDVYVFYRTLPELIEDLPSDGSIILIGIQRLPPSWGSNPFGVDFNGLSPLLTWENADSVHLTGSQWPVYDTVLGDLQHVYYDSLFQLRATRHAVLDVRNLHYRTLMEIRNSPTSAVPVLIVGDNANNSRLKTIILGLDIEFSNLGTVFSTTWMLGNILSYCIPPIISEHLVTVGDTVMLAGRPSTDIVQLLFDNADGHRESREFQTSPEFGLMVAEFKSIVPGRYWIQQQVRGDDGTLGVQQTDNFFVRIAERQSNFAQDLPPIILRMERDNLDIDASIPPNLLDIYVWVALALVALFIIEWWVQYREQF
ncbi:MAG: VWA domain-containing protein [Firmicutes bacterium]|nr:VWA domain-containing protein [Bacillota bacterium]